MGLSTTKIDVRETQKTSSLAGLRAVSRMRPRVSPVYRNSFLKSPADRDLRRNATRLREQNGESKSGIKSSLSAPPARQRTAGHGAGSSPSTCEEGVVKSSIPRQPQVLAAGGVAKACVRTTSTLLLLKLPRTLGEPFAAVGQPLFG